MTKNEIKKTTSIFIKFLPNITLGIILVVALFLRLYRIDQSVWMQNGYDESRDMLVAKHIVVYGENVFRGPLAAGGMNWLRNSPVYYYFIVIIWFFTREPLIFMYVWAIIMTAPVLIGYFIGKKIKDRLAGIILASLLAVNYQMISSSRELLQTHILLILSTAFMWAFISHLRNKKNKYLLLSIIFLFSSLHFHYGVMLALPICSLFITYYLFKENQESESAFWSKILISSTVFISILWSWILLTYRSFPLDQIYFFTKNFGNKYESSFLEQLQKTVLMLSQMLWGDYLPIVISGVFLVIILFSAKKVLNNKNDKEVFIFTTSICLSILFCIFYKHYIAKTYLLFIFPFFLTLIAFTLRLLIKRKLIIGWLIYFLTFLLMLTVGFKKTFDDLPSHSFHDQQMELSQIIYEDYLKTNLAINSSQPDLLISYYTTIRNMPFDGWGSSGIWYYLENKFNKELVKNTSYGLNHTPINKFPQIVYMVCDHRFNQELIQKECVDRFKKSYSLVENSLRQIKTGENLSLWSAQLKYGKTQPTINVVHLELMSN